MTLNINCINHDFISKCRMYNNGQILELIKVLKVQNAEGLHLKVSGAIVSNVRIICVRIISPRSLIFSVAKDQDTLYYYGLILFDNCELAIFVKSIPYHKKPNM